MCRKSTIFFNFQLSVKASCSSHVNTSELMIKNKLFFLMQIFLFESFLNILFYNAKQITRCESNFLEHAQGSTCLSVVVHLWGCDDDGSIDASTAEDTARWTKCSSDVPGGVSTIR